MEKVKNMKYIKRNSKGMQSINAAGTRVFGYTIKDPTIGTEQHLHDHFDQWMDAIFYGNFDKDEGNWTAISKILLKYVSAKNMWLNVTAGVNNIAFGALMIKAERAAGYFATGKDLSKAESLYWSNVTAMFGDMGSNTSDNLISAILKRADIVESQTEQEIGAKAVYKKLISTDTLYAMQEMGEHWMQNKMLLAMMHSHRIINGKAMSFFDYKGDNRKAILKKVLNAEEYANFEKYFTARIEKEQYLESKHNYVEDFVRTFLTKDQARQYVNETKDTDEILAKEFNDEKHIRIIDAFELTNGMATIKKTSDGLDLIDGGQFGLFRDKVVRVNHKMHGIYNKMDAGTIQRIAIGKLAMQFRKWARPGWTKRFGTKFGKSFWNEGRQEFDDGSYVVLAKFLTQPFRDNPMYTKGEGFTVGKAFSNIVSDYISFIGNMKLYYNVLSDQDKANVKRASAEMLMILMVIVLGDIVGSLKPDDDDEEDKSDTSMYDFTMYQIDRLYSELAFYTPPGVINESKKIMQSPMAAVSAMTDIGTFMKNAGEYMFLTDTKRYYRGGPNHKQLKVKVSATKLVPLWNQYVKVANLGNNNRYYRLYGSNR